MNASWSIIAGLTGNVISYISLLIQFYHYYSSNTFASLSAQSCYTSLIARICNIIYYIYRNDILSIVYNTLYSLTVVLQLIGYYIFKEPKQSKDSLDAQSTDPYYSEFTF
jgi:lipid-A-disaccharide synthase-like uncharacterized protein